MSTHTRTATEKFWSWTLWITSGFVFFFLMAPIIAIMPLSVNSGQFLTYPLQGFSFRWYEAFLDSPRWMSAVKNSLIVGSCSTVLASTLGTLASLGLVRATFRGKALLMAVLLSPMIVPLIIIAAGMFFFYTKFGLAGSYVGLIIAHAALGVPFVIITVTATLSGFDKSLYHAGLSMGASPLKTFFDVVIPLIRPGVISGAMFAFVTSFDEVVLVLFLAGPGQRTIPRQMFSGLREQINPTILAVATLLILVSVAFLITLEFLRRRSERLRGLEDHA